MDAYETSLYTAVLITGIIFGITLFYFAYSIIREQRKSLDLYRQNLKAEITTLEKERYRVAKDLHDDLGPILSVIKFNVDQREGKGLDQRLNTASRLVDEVLHRLHDIAANLMPPLLVRKGLVAAIRQYIDQIDGLRGITVQFKYVLITPLSTEQELHIFRIIQEGVHNAIKHAACSKINVQIKEEKHLLYIICHDNGRGFPEEQLSNTTGSGLINLKSRAEILGGTLQLRSSSGEGSFIIITLPLLKHHETKDPHYTG